MRTLLFPLFQNPECLGDKGAFALIRTGIENVFIQAPARAFFAGHRFAVRMKGSFIKVQQIIGLNGQGGAAGMVEQEQPEFQIFKKNLVTVSFDVRIGQKIIPGLPLASA